ncbi:MAG: cell surface protein SprA [Fibromonadales bacterium]|nr:cell surface protein SprA [Fibromonadales bacterium]
MFRIAIVAAFLLWTGLCFAEPGDSAMQSPIQYIPLPPQSEPLKGLLPQKGISDGTPLKTQRPPIVYEHGIDFESRSSVVQARIANSMNKDTLPLWNAYYPELADYSLDMFNIGLNRLWLNSLIGQGNGGVDEPAEGSLFNISLPMKIPAWMKDFGFDRPQLLLQGTMDIRLHGSGVLDDAPGSMENSLWPSPTLSYVPSFIVQGKIGRNITVELNNTEGGLGVRNRVSIVYAEETPGEFEDYVLQRLEAGNTSLSLAGTELTGYAEQHQGLFGIKADWKLGNWNLTTIASQDAGSQESYSIRGRDESTEFQIQDKQFTDHRYYFLTQSMRNAYINARINGNMPPRWNLAGLKLYKRSPLNNKGTTIENTVGVYLPPGSNTHVKITGLPLMEMQAGTDYVFDANTGILRIKGGAQGSLVAASWSGDGTSRQPPTSSVKHGDEVVLIQYDQSTDNLKDIEKLMLRNTYNVGVSSENSSNFILRMKDRSRNAVDFLRTLGVADSATGVILTNDVSIFLKDGSEYTGDMRLPCREMRWYQRNGYPNLEDAARVARERCLEPLRNIDSSSAMSSLYTMSINNLRSLYQFRYYFEAVGKRRRTSISVRDPNSSYSVSGGGCLDIAPNSEKLKAGSEVLVRDVDYQVNYELGQIELISERALDPNKEITVNFECEPLFELQSKLLLGARAEYPLKKFAEGSVFGLTALYKNQSVTTENPRLGGEPFSGLLLGTNLRLRDTSETMDKIINKVPFIDSKEKSRWSFESEFAASYHNSNTSNRKSALIDDFEGSALNLQYPLYRLMWHKASPPGGIESDRGTFIEHQDYKHAGEFVWHSNTTMRYRQIYPQIGNSDVDSREISILSFRLRPNDNLSGKSWGGVMRPNGIYYQDLSQKRYIELVVRGNVGSLYVDLGSISEDISINGYEPNMKLDSETDPGTTMALNDMGLGHSAGVDGKLMVWDCRYSQCSSSEISRTNDRFNPNLIDLSDPPTQINETKGNAGERSFDTEDINRNGQLDTEIRFARYRIDLSTEDPTQFEKLQNGWRRFRIPLDLPDTIVSSTGTPLSNILSEAIFTRLWYGNLGPGIAEGRTQIAEFKIVGNEWLESAGSNEFGIISNPITQNVTGGINADIYAPGSVIVPDSNYMRIQVINNRDNAGFYFTSPNTPRERDTETNAILKEQSLLLEYGGLHPGQEVSATRFFDNEVKDFTSYSNMKLEIHYETKAAETPIRFALQFGRGGLDGSQDYYEWSFKPVKIECRDSERIQDCHERNWKANAFSLPLAEFSNLKILRGGPPFLKPAEKDLGGERQEKIKIVGDPANSNVNWIRFVVIADDNAALEDLAGTFWINDLRLTGINNDWGYATRMHGQLDFSDVFSVSGELRYQDGDFATLKSDGKSPKPTLSEANTRLDVNAAASLNINKFFKDEYGLRLPFGVSYSSTTMRPYLKPEDDVNLSHDNAFDMFGDLAAIDLEIKDTAEERRLRDSLQSKGYQSYLRTKTLSLGFSKDYTKDDNIFQEILSQIFLERPALNYSYRETERRATRIADSSYQYNTVLEYKLGTFERSKLTLFGAPVELWPGTFDLTLMDLSYSRNVNQERDPNFLEPQVDKITNFTTDLRHKADIRWNIFPFLNLNYTLDINRDMHGGGDREAFTKGDFFSLNGDGGLFAKDFIFDYDHTDRRIHVSNNSESIPLDTLYNESGDTTIIWQTARSYEINDVGSREYGKAYGILRNERNRRQDFRINFSPELISFLGMRFSFNSGFVQDKSIPNNFDFYDSEMLSKNFWTIQQNNRFEFSPTLRLPQLAGIAGKNAVSNFFEKWKWREIRSTWSVDLQTSGEDFALWQLYEEQGVEPLQYYLFGLGLGNGYRNRGFWNLVSGDMGLDSRDDYLRFAQYRNQNTDSIVYQGRFEHAVRRNLTNNTALTLPWWDIGVKGDLTWTQTYRQMRETPLFIDTTITWPKFGVGVDIPNFAKRIDFLNSKFRSFSTSHRFDYQEQRTVRPYQSAENEWLTTMDFNPIIRISALTQGNIRIDNSVRFKTEERKRRTKMELPGTEVWEEEDYIKIPWIYTDMTVDRGYAFGDELSIAYALKTKRGFQFWRWYMKLDNDIDLKFTSGYSYRKLIQESYATHPGYNPYDSSRVSGSNGEVHFIAKTPEGDTLISYNPLLEKLPRSIPTRAHEWYVRPSAAYMFNKVASASAYIEYRQLIEQLNDGYTHTRQTLSFEIAVMLRFN